MRTLASLSVLLCLGLLGALVAADRVVAEDDAKSPRRATSPRDEALVALGRRLFFDPAISRSGARSCASCHDPDHGFSDPGRVSDDDFGRTRRHSQTLLDGHLNPSAHWDGEFATVEELVLARIGSIKGRKGKLGHGSTLEDALSEQFGGEPSGPFTEPAEETSDQTDPLPEDEREKPREDKDYDGGGREFRAPTSSGDQPSARGPA
ncbi:MAG: cytochrome-c peroxidase, partial [Planctomycetota bacterium]|nr:cytochrome-c peroxidase [Planctomycetota bacterium]